MLKLSVTPSFNFHKFRQSGVGVKPNKQKYSYQRPAFLKLATEDEIQVTCFPIILLTTFFSPNKCWTFFPLEYGLHLTGDC